MKSKLFLNLALLAAVALLGVLAFFEPGKKKPETTPLATVDENTLDAVTLKNKDTITFEKKDGHWRLAAPFPAPANEIRVRQLIDIVKAHSEAQYPVNPQELAKFELDQPKVSLTLGTLTLDFGGSDPINMRRYVRAGDTLHLVDDDFYHHLMATATDYVDKKLLPETAKIKEIAVPGLKASLGPDGKWIQEGAGEAKADLSELASTWNTARAIDVKRLEGPVQGDTAKITLAEGSPVEFVIVQKEPDLILARRDLGLQYELTGEAARVLLNLPKPPPAPAAAGQPQPGEESPEDADNDGEAEFEDEGIHEDEGTGEDPEDDSESAGPLPNPTDEVAPIEPADDE
jgi:hypothetical protein